LYKTWYKIAESWDRYATCWIQLTYDVAIIAILFTSAGMLLLLAASIISTGKSILLKIVLKSVTGPLNLFILFNISWICWSILFLSSYGL
jgi:hypothetical protein